MLFSVGNVRGEGAVTVIAAAIIDAAAAVAAAAAAPVAVLVLVVVVATVASSRTVVLNSVWCLFCATRQKRLSHVTTGWHRYGATRVRKVCPRRLQYLYKVSWMLGKDFLY